MGNIRILKKSVAERIAAGEVVERPASVVKELIENSLDAGATQIVITIEGAGSTLIRVSDDGRGMDPDDLRLSIRRFATSKITSLDDLETASSFGFRGEALPSIAAVSHLEIVSAPPGAREGRRLRLVGGEQTTDEAIGAPPGTSVTVRRLFFNTPARLKFLKSPSREFALIVDAANRLALASPHVAFRVIHEEDEVRRYTAGRQEDRVAAVLGHSVFERMVALAAGAGNVAISGWLGKPDLARAVRRQQYQFVNRRSVHNRTINSAIDQAYQQLVPAGRYPVYVVFVDVPGHRVDVNVHPRKLEIRFDDDHQLFAAVSNAVRSALRGVSIAPVIAATPATPEIRSREFPGPPVIQSAPGIPELGLGDISDFMPVSEAADVSGVGRLPAMRLLGQLHATYLLAQSNDGLVIIDQHAAHERILYERLLRTRQRSQGSDGQLLVEPVAVSLSGDEAAAVSAHGAVLEQVGFGLEPFGDRTVLIRRIPSVVQGSGVESLLRDLLAELATESRPTAAHARLERLTIATACHTAVRAGDRLSSEQMAALLRDLAQTDDPFTCFHGRPTLVTVPLPSIERWFLRK